MPCRLSQPLPPLPPLFDEESARDLLAQAQAALADGQPGAALRALSRLHDLAVPALDQHLSADAPGCAQGLLPLFRDLPDLDIERENVAELLVFYAAQAEAPLTWVEIAERIAAEPLPTPSWWRRLRLSAAGPLGDRVRIQVVRGSQVVLERLPDPEGQRAWEADLGPFTSGDRLTLQAQVPLPGRVAVLHAQGDAQEAELSVLFPQEASEEEVRRAQEIVEVAGELQRVPDAPEQALLLVWAPEPIPAAFLGHVLHRGRLPEGARLWRCRYKVR
jgi:hypothetical protein